MKAWIIFTWDRRPKQAPPPPPKKKRGKNPIEQKEVKTCDPQVDRAQPKIFAGWVLIDNNSP